MTETVKNVENKEVGKESKKKEPKQVWQIVEDIYGKNSWKTMAPKLAAKFDIKNYVGSGPQNVLIAQKLLSGDRLENKTTLEAMNKFFPDKQKLLRENAGDINDQYLANLTSENIAKLNTINDPSKFI
jgi:hypothetical protein